MIRINLLPVRAARRKESIRIQFTIAGLVIAFFLLIILGVFLKINSDIGFVEDEIIDVKKEQKVVDARIGDLKNIKDLIKKVEDKLGTIHKLDLQRSGPVKFFAKLEAALPENAWIQSISENKNIVKIVGYALDNDVVSKFYAGLQKFKSLGLVELKETRNIVKYKRNVQQFVITIEAPKPPVAKKPKKGKKRKK
ncbi:MAG: PilN domain-containing protein [Deltaproteobacteria bacterium]|nr:PilN domain-containing protein [Deltaproteobacteria bacterium]